MAAQLTRIERDGGSGELRIGAARLPVSHLGKVFFPDGGWTKGDVMRYYAAVAPAILPAIAGRPLALRRSPDGIDGQVFFQQAAPPAAQLPRGVRAGAVPGQGGGAGVEPSNRRLIGGTLATLLYTVQLGCIEVDPWLSRAATPDEPDHAILDLDPGADATFDRVVAVAQSVGEVLESLGLRAALKTSGSRGIHIALPLPGGLSYQSAVLLAELVATRVSERHRGTGEVTLERRLETRPAGAVYVDYLQNARGKTVAAAYCVRPRPGATVSAPLEWRELRRGLALSAFTMRTMPARLARRGDLWRAALRRRNSVRAIRSAIGVHEAHG